MVVSSFERIDGTPVVGAEAQKRNAWSTARRLQLLAIAAVACVTLIAAPMLSSVVDSGPVSLAAPGGKVDSLSSSILGGLEKAMDSSVDTKVKAVLKSPAAREQALSQLPAASASSVAAPKAAREQQLMLQQPYHRAVPVTAAAGYHRLLPFDPHPYVTQTQLDRLTAEKMELERKREAILRTLRMRRQAAAAKAAKDATELDKIRLQRAVEAAKTRQLEQAERAARAASAKMRQAAIAKQEAIHAEQVAQARQRELDYMGAVNRARYEHAARLDNAADAAADMQYQQDKSLVDAKLQGYLSQERDLLHKIAAVEQVARHGGRWPEGGMPKESAMPTPNFAMSQKGDAPQLAEQQQQQQQQQPHGAPNEDSAARKAMVKTIMGAVEKNEEEIKAGEAKQEGLEGEMKAEDGRMKGLQATDARLEREIEQAQQQQ